MSIVTDPDYHRVGTSAAAHYGDHSDITRLTVGIKLPTYTRRYRYHPYKGPGISSPLNIAASLLAGSMINSREPTVISQDFFTLAKFWHFVDGLFIWEFLTTISYEWSVTQGHRPYRWTIWIYSLTRVAALMAVILNIVGLDVTTAINCQASIIAQFVFAYLSLTSATFLIVLRIIAIWNKNRIVSIIASTVWGTEVAFLIHSISRFYAEWVPERDSCAMLNPESTKLGVIVALITDVVLFLIMLSGLLRLRIHGSGPLIVGRFLWKQGVIWFLIATVAEIPPTVFICLNMNGPLSIMFQIPCLIVMSIAASRMYRSLVDFISSNVSHESPPNTCPTIHITKGPHIPPAMPTRFEVAVHRDYEYPVSPTHQFGPYMNINEKLREKPGMLNHGNNPKGGLGPRELR